MENIVIPDYQEQLREGNFIDIPFHVTKEGVVRAEDNFVPELLYFPETDTWDADYKDGIGWNFDYDYPPGYSVDRAFYDIYTNEEWSARAEKEPGAMYMVTGVYVDKPDEETTDLVGLMVLKKAAE